MACMNLPFLSVYVFISGHLLLDRDVLVGVPMGGSLSPQKNSGKFGKFTPIPKLWWSMRAENVFSHLQSLTSHEACIFLLPGSWCSFLRRCVAYVCAQVCTCVHPPYTREKSGMIDNCMKKISPNYLLPIRNTLHWQRYTLTGRKRVEGNTPSTWKPRTSKNSFIYIW